MALPTSIIKNTVAKTEKFKKFSIFNIENIDKLDLSSQLEIAVKCNDCEAAKALLDSGKVSLKNLTLTFLEKKPEGSIPSFQNTILQLVLELGSLDMIKLCLTYNPNLNNCSDQSGRTPLAIVAERGSRAMIKTLLNAGADINGYGETMLGYLPRAQATALHHVMFKRDSATFQYLLSQGADINALHIQKAHPLVEAYNKKHHSLFKPYKSADLEETPLDIVRRLQDPADLLIRADILSKELFKSERTNLKAMETILVEHDAKTAKELRQHKQSCNLF